MFVLYQIHGRYGSGRVSHAVFAFIFWTETDYN